jgi:hypothetical protein
MKSVLAALLALFLGILPGFFIVFSGVFTDPSTVSERIGSLLIAFFVYGILGLIFGRWTSLPPIGSTLLLNATSIIILVWYTFRESGSWPLHLLYLLIGIGGAILGSYIGWNWKRKSIYIRNNSNLPFTLL